MKIYTPDFYTLTLNECNDIIYDFNFRTTTSFSVIADDMGNYYISAFEDKNFEHWKEVTQC